MKKVNVYYACINCGDGSVSLDWFLTYEEAKTAENEQMEGWAEDCTGMVETFEGSNIHKEALKKAYIEED